MKNKDERDKASKGEDSTRSQRRQGQARGNFAKGNETGKDRRDEDQKYDIDDEDTLKKKSKMWPQALAAAIRDGRNREGELEERTSVRAMEKPLRAPSRDDDRPRKRRVKA